MRQNLIHSSHCTAPFLLHRFRLTLPQIQPLFDRNSIFSIFITLAIDATFSQMTLLKTVPSPKPESQAEGGLGPHWRPGGHSTTLLLRGPCHLHWHPWQPEHLCFLRGHSTWPPSSPERPLPSLLVSSSSDVSFLGFFPLCLKTLVPLSGEEVFDILAKANPVLSCLLSLLAPYAIGSLLSHLVPEAKNASHPSASAWPSGTCPMPTGRLRQASLGIPHSLCASCAAGHAPVETNLWLPSLYVLPL